MSKLDNNQWFQCDLHTHTDHSDGEHTRSEAIKIAMDEGLSCIALTDHNTYTQNAELPIFEDFAVIPGVEFTTASGHVNFLGVKKPVVDLKYQTAEGVVETMKEADEAGAYISINHPFVGDRWRWGFDHVTFHAVEIWNGTLLTRNNEVIKWWQSQLSEGKKIYITGGSDVHDQGAKNRWYGKGRTFINASSLTAEALVSALKQGHNGVMASGTSSTCEICIEENMMGDTAWVKTETVTLDVEMDTNIDVILRIYGSDGMVLEQPFNAGVNNIYSFILSAYSAFYRAEVWQKGENDKLVNPFLTNPIYIIQE